MCTAIGYHPKGFYFGRTLDYDISFGEEIVMTPRRYLPGQRYAICGMAHTTDGYPLYYDAMNETGLCMAGLNFPVSACYGKEKPGMENVASYALLPRILGQCAHLDEAREALFRIHLTDESFSPDFPAAPLHWMLGDETGCIAVEQTEHGLHIWENPVGVLTNEPPFPRQMENLTHFMQLSPHEPINRFSSNLELTPISRGMGAMGLPGDLSSPSRFVRAAFTKENSVSGDTESDCVLQFFHILDTVSQVKGCCRLQNGGLEFTRYASCCSTQTGIYYYRSYESSRICAVSMKNADLDAAELLRFPFLSPQDFCPQN